MIKQPIINLLGWLFLASTFKPLVLIFLGSKLGGVLSEGKMISLALTAMPPVVLAVLGAIGMINHRIAGAFGIYAAFLLMGFGLMNFTLLPFTEGVIPKSPFAGDYALTINCLMVALLAAIHWRNLREEPAFKSHRGLIVALVMIALVAHGYRRLLVQHLDGQAAFSSLSYAELVAPLTSSRPVEHRSLKESNLTLSAVFSGETTEANLKEFVQAHELKPLEYSEKLREKNLPLARSWQLDPARFPQEFSGHDQFYIGRVKGHPRLVVQIAWRKADGRFTAMLMGLL